MVISCNMALKFILFLMISTFLKLPNAVAMPSDIIDKDIFINIVGNEFHGNNNMFVNGGSNGLVENQKIMINQNISKFRGNNLISVNENIGSNIKSDTTFQVTATQSEDKTLEITAIPSDDKTLEITAIPSEDETFAITAIPSQDKTLKITALPSEVTTLVIAETTSVPTTELPATTLVIAETTVVATTKLPATTLLIDETTAVTTTKRPVRACIAPSVKFGSQCLRFSDDALSWDDASAACANNGGRLATLDNPEDVYDYATVNYPRLRFWVSGTDAATEGSWLWSSGRPVDEQFQWPGSEPNGGTRENCMLLDTGNGYADYRCSYTSRYICEYGPF